MKVQAIIASGGKGVRFNHKVIKPFALLNGKPLLVYCLEIFDRIAAVDSIIVAASSEHLSQFNRIIDEHNIKKVDKVIAGGETRRASVYNGLKALDGDTRFVLVHDAARPFPDEDLIKKAIQAAQKTKAAIMAVPVKSTFKIINKDQMTVQETPNRENLWEAQTPQVFEKDVLLKAHEENKDLAATDDAFLVEQIGVPVHIIEGNYTNIKITTSEDLVIARTILEKAQKNS